MEVMNAVENTLQFNEVVLDCCLLLLDKSGLSYRMRGDPVQVVRKIAALVSSESIVLFSHTFDI